LLEFLSIFPHVVGQICITLALAKRLRKKHGSREII
jgi:hypothetical protein